MLVIGKTRYLCCTLWTDFALNGPAVGGMYEAGRMMNDYRYIRMEEDGYRRITPDHVAAVHARHRAWLETQLATPFAGRTVVVTHHAPLRAGLAEASPVAAAYQ